MASSCEDVLALVSTVSGPLAPHLKTYVASLIEGGYSLTSLRTKARYAVVFNDWLARRHIGLPELCDIHIARFHCRSYQPRRDCHAEYRCHEVAELHSLLVYLRAQGLCSSPGVDASPISDYLQHFRKYLLYDRGLTSGTADYYCASAKAFLLYRYGNGPLELESVNAKDVVDFIRTRARKTKPRTLRLTITGLRAFLRYCLFRGEIKAQLVDVVPAVASWYIRPELPRAISPDHARGVLDSCNTNTVVGLRDRAILLLLARLGLRSAEIRALQLEDVDWDAGHLRIQGKNGRETLMPLPVDVGEAIAAYLAQGRPQRSDRHLFLRVHAPITGLNSADAVGYIVSNALERAGIDTPHRGAHQFRHALAVHLLRQGATLPEIGEVLRHRNLISTSIYARVDIAALRSLAMPWPGSQS